MASIDAELLHGCLGLAARRVRPYDVLMTKRILLLLALAGLMAACSGKNGALPATTASSGPSPTATDATAATAGTAVESASPAYWPTDGWRTSDPASQGMDPAKINAAFESVAKQNLGLHGVVVIRHGYIVSEKYYGRYSADSADEIYSCTKSFTSALIGIAIGKGFIKDVQQPVLGFFRNMGFAQVDARKQAMKLEDLLTMSSGLGWVEGDATYRDMYVSSRNWVRYVLDLPMVAAPGQAFNYSSGNSHVLAAIIQARTGKSTAEFARTSLFDPIGIRNPRWDTDPSGIPIGGWGLKLSARDMAKLGFLYLHRGVWDGKQVVPASWVSVSTTPHIMANGTWSYGYQWWIDESVPMYAAQGRFGQAIFVVPGKDLVVSFTAQIESGDSEASLVKNYFLPACKTGT